MDHFALIVGTLATVVLALLGVAGMFISAMSGVRSELASVRIELMSILRDLSTKLEDHGERLRVVEDRSERVAK